MEHAPPDLLKADYIKLRVRDGVELRFDMPRVGDLAKYIFEEREDRLLKLREHQDIIKDDNVKLSMLIQFTALNMESMFRMIATLRGQAWLVDRCYLRANEEVKDSYVLSNVLSIEEVRELWTMLCTLTGLIDANPPAKGEEDDEKPETSPGTKSTQG